jgi:hypothetical protein
VAQPDIIRLKAARVKIERPFQIRTCISPAKVIIPWIKSKFKDYHAQIAVFSPFEG